MRWWFSRDDKKFKEHSTESENGTDKNLSFNKDDETLKDFSIESELRAGNRLQKGMIITDDISFSPILDFEDYVNSLTKIIKNSYPKFSIGIYGEWGTGKTTLMTAIYNRLWKNKDDKSIIPVWFNAWRYEREEQFAIIPLLKTIAYAIPEDRKDLKDLKEKLKKGGMNFLKKIPDIIPSIAGQYFGEGARNVTDEMIKSFKEQFIPKLELLSEVDKETIYFDGLDNIEEELRKIRAKNLSFKIVVFVDDLDRCSPDKALQVLESIKVFLDIDGFIYVIGLSFNKISQLITAYYKEKYKDIGIEGDQYLKKIIQIPIILSDWNSDDIKTLIQDFIEKKVVENEEYQQIIKENIDLISTGLEENPREAKRFLNNFIVAQEILSKKGTKPRELLILQILNMRWNEIYRLIVNSNGKYLNKLKPYLDNEEELKKLMTTKPEDTDLQADLGTLQKFLADRKLREFLVSNYDKMNNISDWKVYRRASKISQEPIIQTTDLKAKALMLLQNGDVNRFNKFVKDNNLTELEFTGAILSGANLSGANLSGANLSGGKLIGTNLSGADLSGSKLIGTNLSDTNLSDTNLSGAKLVSANLSGAKLVSANLSGADLVGADLRDANLRDANLSGANLKYAYLRDANLSRAILSGADLRDANLRGADLKNAIIINLTTYQSMELDENNEFENAIIDDPQFFEYIGKFTSNVPEKILDKKQLKIKLEKRRWSGDSLQKLLQSSKLPE